MPKRKIFTKKLYEKALKDKLGQGDLDQYKPWLTVYDVKSHGTSFRSYSTWTLPPEKNRVFHLLSQLEYRWFLIHDWNENVVDIREQYPLLPLDLAMDIARELGIKYPREHRSPCRQPYVLTTDFYLKLRVEGKDYLQARSVKYVKSLENDRTKEKIKLERTFWNHHGLNKGNNGFALITEEEGTKALAHNIERVRGAYSLTYALEIEYDKKIQACEYLFQQLKSGCLIREATRATESRFNLKKPGSGLTLLNHMIARRSISVDMDQKFRTDVQLPLGSFIPELLPNEDQKN